MKTPCLDQNPAHVAYRGRSQHGIGLIEVLVAMLLLAIGVVGFAGLQVRAVSATSEAFQRGQAMIIARDMGERMRANLDARAVYTLETNWTTPATPTLPTPNCLMVNCTAAQMAIFDIYEIRTLAATVGVNGDARMSACAGNAGLSCLYIAWNDTKPVNATSSDTTSCTVNGSFQPASNCIMLETY